MGQLNYMASINRTSSQFVQEVQTFKYKYLVPALNEAGDNGEDGLIAIFAFMECITGMLMDSYGQDRTKAIETFRNMTEGHIKDWKNNPLYDQSSGEC